MVLVVVLGMFLEVDRQLVLPRLAVQVALAVVVLGLMLVMAVLVSPNMLIVLQLLQFGLLETQETLLCILLLLLAVAAVVVLLKQVAVHLLI